MSTKTTYISTVTVPVYASWKCEKCGAVNFTTGEITCKREESSKSWFTSIQNEAKERAAARAKAEWTRDAFRIINDPNRRGSAMYENFFLQNTKCVGCGKKPRWNKNLKFPPLIALCMPVALLSGLAAFALMTSVAAWLIFLGSVGFIAWSIIQQTVYSRMMIDFPKKYTPVIGSLNAELIEYAKTLGSKIPTPEECIATVKGYDPIANTAVPKAQAVDAAPAGPQAQNETGGKDSYL